MPVDPLRRAPDEQDARRFIGILVFEGALLLNAVGPAECFAMANRATAREGRPDSYHVELLSVRGGLVAGTAGIAVDTVALSEREDTTFDTIAVVGGIGVRAIGPHDPLTLWLRRHAVRAGRVTSFGSGSFALAQAGLLDGRRCAAHWRIAGDLKRLHPRVLVQTDSLFVQDGNYLSAAGSSASIDLALKMVEDDLGKDVAIRVAQIMIVSRVRTGEQPQLSAELRAQLAASPRIAIAAEWMVAHIDARPRVAQVAARFAMSERTFSRQFSREMGMTPRRFLELARLEAARRWLVGSTLPMEKVALRAGYTSAEQFKNAFRSAMGTVPTVYRQMAQDGLA